MVIIKTKLMGEIENEQGTHAVKTEVLPDLDRHDIVYRARL